MAEKCTDFFDGDLYRREAGKRADCLVVSPDDIRFIGRSVIDAMRAARRNPESDLFFNLDLEATTFPNLRQLSNVLVCHRNQLLMLHRKTDPFAGSWSIPGGGVEIDEPNEAAARRELYEEVGIEAERLQPMYTIGSHALEIECHLYKYASRHGNFVPDAEPGQHDSVGFVATGEALQLGLTPGLWLPLAGLHDLMTA